MVIPPELKCLVEDYADDSARFLEIINFYRRSGSEVKKYMDQVVHNLTGKEFHEQFAPLLGGGGSGNRTGRKVHKR